MQPPAAAGDRARARNLLYLARPKLWPTWPFLALVRRRPGKEEEYGVLYDAYNVSGKTGYAATVFLSNLFLLPPSEDQILALPHETYDTPEEIYGAEWRVD